MLQCSYRGFPLKRIAMAGIMCYEHITPCMRCTTTPYNRYPGTTTDAIITHSFPFAKNVVFYRFPCDQSAWMGLCPLHALFLCAPQGAGAAEPCPAAPGRPLTKFRSGDKTYRTDRVVKREGQAHAWPSFDLIFFKYSVSKGPKAPMAPCPSGGCGQLGACSLRERCASRAGNEPFPQTPFKALNPLSG